MVEQAGQGFFDGAGDGRPVSRLRLAQALAQSLERAWHYAREQSNARVTVEHVLLALTEDPIIALSLQACVPDLGRLRDDTASYLASVEGSVSGPQAVDPMIAPELQLILDRAAGVAQQLQRDDVTAFMLLATIVAEPETPAARILQAHGFTLDTALQTLLPAPADAQPVAIAAGGNPRALADVRDEAPLPTPVVNRGAGAVAHQALPATDDVMASVKAMIDLTAQRVNSEPPIGPVAATAEQTAPFIAPWPDTGTDGEATRPPTHGPHTPLARVPDMVAHPPAVGRQTGGLNVRLASTPPSRQALPGDMGPAPRQDAGSQRRVENAGPVGQYARATPAAAGQSTGSSRPSPSQPVTLPNPSRGMPPIATGHGQGPRSGPAMVIPQTMYPGPNPASPPRYPDLGSAVPPSRPATAGANRLVPPVAANSSLNRELRVSADDMLAGAPYPAMEETDRRHRPPTNAQETAGFDTGRSRPVPVNLDRLVKAFPDRIRLGKTQTIELRIYRREIEAFAEAARRNPAALPATTGKPAPVPAPMLIAICVRLNGTELGVQVEPEYPETRWLEHSHGLIQPDEAIAWRWLVTPSLKGRHELTLTVSGRAITAADFGAEGALPPQIIVIKAHGSRGRPVLRVIGWIVAGGLGFGLAKVADIGSSPAASGAIKTLMQLLGFSRG